MQRRCRQAVQELAALVEDWDGTDLLQVDTYGTHQIRCSAPVLMDQIMTSTPGADLVITLQ